MSKLDSCAEEEGFFVHDLGLTATSEELKMGSRSTAEDTGLDTTALSVLDMAFDEAGCVLS